MSNHGAGRVSNQKSTAPLSDTIIHAVARLVDDAQLEEKRQPTHSSIEFEIKRCALQQGDPNAHGQVVGKAKRVRGTLSWAVEHDMQAGEMFVAKLIALIRGHGGFRQTSPNYVGSDVIVDAANAFRAEGFELSTDGELHPLVLEGLSGVQLTHALELYVRRARRGSEDAALVTGTGKDLLEAIAAHVLQECFGSYNTSFNFPTLLGQAFVAVGLATPNDSPQPNEPAVKRLERALYDTGCAVNKLRNKEGAGHGRPWLPSLSAPEARLATEQMGIIAEHLLMALRHHKGIP